MVLIPLLFGGATWFTLEFNRSKCAYLGFFEARQKLLITGKPVHFLKACGQLKEQIDLLPLEALDEDKGGLSIGDYANQASQLWEQASSFYQRSQTLGSIKSLPEPKL